MSTPCAGEVAFTWIPSPPLRPTETRLHLAVATAFYFYYETPWPAGVRLLLGLDETQGENILYINCKDRVRETAIPSCV